MHTGRIISFVIGILAILFMNSSCSEKTSISTKTERSNSDEMVSLRKETSDLSSKEAPIKSRDMKLKHRESKIRKGESMRDFTAKAVSGDEIQFSEYQKDKYVLIDFWATWCRPCLREIPHLQKVMEKYGDKKNFAILGVSLDKDSERVRKFVEKNKLDYPHIFDGNMWQSHVAMLYGVNAIPFTVLIGPNGKVVETNLRGSRLIQYLDKHLDG